MTDDLTYKEIRKVYVQARTGYGQTIDPLPRGPRGTIMPVAMHEFDSFVQRERAAAIAEFRREYDID